MLLNGWGSSPLCVENLAIVQVGLQEACHSRFSHSSKVGTHSSIIPILPSPRGTLARRSTPIPSLNIPLPFSLPPLRELPIPGTLLSIPITSLRILPLPLRTSFSRMLLAWRRYNCVTWSNLCARDRDRWVRGIAVCDMGGGFTGVVHLVWV
jgi:hypothetical protein